MTLLGSRCPSLGLSARVGGSALGRVCGLGGGSGFGAVCAVASASSASSCCVANRASLSLSVDTPSGSVTASGELNSCAGTACQGCPQTKRYSCTNATRRGYVASSSCWNVSSVIQHSA